MRFYLINISSINEKIEEHIKENYPLRYQRALKYKNHDDYLRSLAAYYILEKAIGYFDETKIEYGINGKPFLNGKPFFNYSHSGDFVALVIDKKREVGIDIQVFGNKDKNYIIEWTKKEAAIKLVGGVMAPHVEIPNTFKGNKIKVKTVKITNQYALSIARARGDI